jgi:hypothetical protein
VTGVASTVTPFADPSGTASHVLRRLPQPSTSDGIHRAAQDEIDREVRIPRFLLVPTIPSTPDRYASSLRHALIKSRTEGSPYKVRTVMDYRVSYEHSLKNQPDEFIVHVPSQLVENIPANVPRALLPESILAT